MSRCSLPNTLQIIEKHWIVYSETIEKNITKPGSWAAYNIKYKINAQDAGGGVAQRYTSVYIPVY